MRKRRRSAVRGRQVRSGTFRSPFRGRGLADNLDAIVLDHRVGEELLGRCLQSRLGVLLVAAVDLDVEYLALTDARDAGDAERLQRALDRLALRVENAVLEGNRDAGFHTVEI